MSHTSLHACMFMYHYMFGVLHPKCGGWVGACAMIAPDCSVSPTHPPLKLHNGWWTSNADIRLASATKNGQATNLTKCEVNISIESPSSATKEKDRCAIKHSVHFHAVMSMFSCHVSCMFVFVCLVYVLRRRANDVWRMRQIYMFDYICDFKYRYALCLEQCILLYPRLIHYHNLTCCVSWNLFERSFWL